MHLPFPLCRYPKPASPYGLADGQMFFCFFPIRATCAIRQRRFFSALRGARAAWQLFPICAPAHKKARFRPVSENGLTLTKPYSDRHDNAVHILPTWPASVSAVAKRFQFQVRSSNSVYRTTGILPLWSTTGTPANYLRAVVLCPHVSKAITSRLFTYMSVFSKLKCSPCHFFTLRRLAPFPVL